MLSGFFYVLPSGNFQVQICVMLETQIIHWINSDQDYHAGIYLLKQIHPLDPLIGKIETADHHKALLIKIGQALRSGRLQTTQAADTVIMVHTEPQKQPPADHLPAVDVVAPTDQPAGLTDAQRLSIEIGNIRKTRAYYHNQLHDQHSDHQRSATMLLIDKATDDIKYKNKLVRQLESGELQQLPAETTTTADQFTVPDQADTMDLFEIDSMIRRYRSTRSKRAAKISRLEKENQKGSPDYQQAVEQFQQLDHSIKALDEIKKIRQKSTAEV